MSIMRSSITLTKTLENVNIYNINEMYVKALLSYDHYVSEKQSGKLFNCFIRSEIYECYNIE